MSLPDVEAMVVTFLKPIVAPTKTASLVPAERPDLFVRAFRSGGSAVNRILENAQVTVEAEAPTRDEAFDLASACREHFQHHYTLMPLVRGVSETGGLYFAPDPDTNIPRFRFTVNLLVRSSR